MKTGKQYGDELREIRAAGFDFPASRGYTLANPSQWSSGQKAAVSRAFNKLELTADEATEEELEEQIARGEMAPDGGDDEDFDTEFFDDSAGDDDEEWDDIDFFDFDEGEEFLDEESDTYSEAP